MHEFKKGESVWVINGARTRAFAAEVVGVNSAAVLVTITDKDGEVQLFHPDSGLAVEDHTRPFKGDPPLLVPLENELANRLEFEFQVRQGAEDVQKLVRDYRDNPTDIAFEDIITELTELRKYIKNNSK